MISRPSRGPRHGGDTGRFRKVKLALTACMRKLLVILNAMVRDGRRWADSGLSM